MKLSVASLNIYMPFISIIVPTYNSGKSLKKCLQSIRNQNYKRVEIIVVDQESTDDTLVIAKEYKAKVISVSRPKFYSPPSVSRNFGAKKAKGTILYHLDSDMELSENLLAEIVEKLSNNVYGGLIVHEKDKTKGFWSKCKALERRCYWGDARIESARVIRANIFKKIGGYDKSISSGEDFDIQHRYQQVSKIGFCSQICYHNLESLGFLKSVIKKYNYGKTAKQYFVKTQNTPTSIVIAEMEDFIKNWRLLVSNPFLACGMIIMKSSELIAGQVGRMRSAYL